MVGRALLAFPALAGFCLLLSAAQAGDDAGFEKMPPPRPGEWLHEFHETAQSAADHRRQCRNRVTAERRKIYILPVGKIAERRADLIAALRDYLAAFFGLECTVLEPADPPASAWVARRRQFDAGALLPWIKARVPKDASACGAFLEEDLFSEDLNFVFGLASLSDRVGVYSIARLDERYEGAPPGAGLLRRTLGLATHELGHVFGIHHCVTYRCNMNGSNSLEESDGQPLHYCPIDLEKLAFACGVDLTARYGALERFYRAHGLAGEAAFCAARLGPKLY